MTHTADHAAAKQAGTRDGQAPARRAAKTAVGEGDKYWFFGGRTVIRSPEGARPVIDASQDR